MNTWWRGLERYSFTFRNYIASFPHNITYLRKFHLNPAKIKPYKVKHPNVDTTPNVDSFE